MKTLIWTTEDGSLEAFCPAYPWIIGEKKESKGASLAVRKVLLLERVRLSLLRHKEDVKNIEVADAEGQAPNPLPPHKAHFCCDCADEFTPAKEGDIYCGGEECRKAGMHP